MTGASRDLNSVNRAEGAGLLPIMSEGKGGKSGKWSLLYSFLSLSHMHTTWPSLLQVQTECTGSVSLFTKCACWLREFGECGRE